MRVFLDPGAFQGHQKADGSIFFVREYRALYLSLAFSPPRYIFVESGKEKP